MTRTFKRDRRLNYIIFLSVVCAGSAALCATAALRANSQSKAPPPTPHPNVPPGPAVVAPQQAAAPAQPNLDGVNGDFEGDEKSGIYTGHSWTYTRNDLVAKGSVAIWDKKKDTLDTDQPVVVDDKKYHLTSDLAHIEHVDKGRKDRTVTLTGHVVMVMKPETPSAGAPPVNPDKAQKPDAQPKAPPAAAAGTADKTKQDIQDDKKHGGVATCDTLVYKTTGKVTTLNGHVVFKQSFVDKEGKQIERTLVCDHAEHNGKTDELHLFKPVHYSDNQNQTLNTPNDLYLGTKEGEESIRGTDMHFSFPPEKDDDEPEPGTAKGTPDKKAQKPPK